MNVIPEQHVDLSSWQSPSPGLIVTVPGGARVRFAPPEEMDSQDAIAVMDAYVAITKMTAGGNPQLESLSALMTAVDTIISRSMTPADAQVWRDARVPIGAILALMPSLERVIGGSPEEAGRQAAASMQTPPMPAPSAPVAPSAQTILHQHQGPAAAPVMSPGEAPGSSTSWVGTGISSPGTGSIADSTFGRGPMTQAGP